MRMVGEGYHVPDGYFDSPFCYVFDATGIADFQAVFQNVQLPLSGDGSTFILRHIAGVPLCVAAPTGGGRFSFKNVNDSYASKNVQVSGGFVNTQTGIIMPNNWPVLPEKAYPLGSAIYMDFFNTTRTQTICAEGTIFHSFIGFFGVKRFKKGLRQWYDTPYQWTEQQQTYNFVLTLNTPHFNASGVVNPVLTFQQQVNDYDFELMRILISQQGAAVALTTNDFQMTLYDPFLYAMSNIPINQGFINSARPAQNTAPPYQGVFPVPTMTYPAGSNIQFDIRSMLCSAVLPITYNISFEGVWRLPA